MRRLLSLLLILCLAAEFLPACTDAEASDYLHGAAARRSRASAGYEAPTDHFYDFEAGRPDWFTQANVDATEATTYTVFAIIDPESVIGTPYWTANKKPPGGAANTWYSYLTNNGGDVRMHGYSATNSCTGSSNETEETGIAVPGPLMLVSLSFDYSGNPGVFDSTIEVCVITAARGIECNSSATFQGPVLDCAGTLQIGAEYSTGTNPFDGKYYAWGYYAGKIVSADLEDIFDGTKHPATDFTPVMYVDFSKPVADTYAPEVGAEYVFTVHGDPVQGP